MSYKALFLDRDGVINFDYDYVYKIKDIKFIPGIFEAARNAVKRDYLVFIVTNQAGIGRGKYSESDFIKVTKYIENEFEKSDVKITKTYFCPYHPEHGIGNYKKASNDRKPAPGMILRAAKEFDIDLDSSIMIGDKESDIEAGLNAGIKANILFAPEGKTTKTKASKVISDLSKIKDYL